MGIATGLVVVGDLIGSGAAQEQAVVGETPNLAARLQGVAEPNKSSSPRVHESFSAIYSSLEDLGPKDLKGFAGQCTLGRRCGQARWRAGSRRYARRPRRSSAATRRSICSCDAGSRQSAARVVWCWSRANPVLASRASRKLSWNGSAASHTRGLRYFCSPHHQDSALYPSIAQLERAAGLRREDTAEQRLEKLEAVLAQGTNDLSQVVPLLADLLSIPTGDRYPPLDLTPQKRKEKTLKPKWRSSRDWRHVNRC